MICYMLIINMPLWITVYLRNKWCLNLESWIEIMFSPYISGSLHGPWGDLLVITALHVASYYPGVY